MVPTIWASTSTEPRPTRRFYRRTDEYCRWVEQMEDQQSQWKLKRFSSCLKLQCVYQEPNLVNNKTQERMTRRIWQLDNEKLFAEVQASLKTMNKTNTSHNERTRQTSHDTRPERSQLDNSPGGGKHLVGGANSEMVGTTSVADDVFAGACGGGLGRELCGMAEALGKNTVMIAMSS